MVTADHDGGDALNVHSAHQVPQTRVRLVLFLVRWGQCDNDDVDGVGLGGLYRRPIIIRPGYVPSDVPGEIDGARGKAGRIRVDKERIHNAWIASMPRKAV